MGIPEYRETKMVLVVDDSAFIREMIRRIADTLGHSFAEAEDGAAGLQLARACDPDLVVLDVKLPGMDGLAGLQAKGPTEVREPGLSRDHTERMLVHMGAPLQVNRDKRAVLVNPARAR